MPRINLSNDLYSNPRFKKLVLSTGHEWTALGALFYAWAIADKHFSIENPLGVVPHDDWLKAEPHPDILRFGLAYIEEGQVRMAGAAEQFAPLLRKVLRSQKGGHAKAVLKKCAAKSNKTSKDVLKQSQAEPSTLNSALLLSPSSSSSSFPSTLTKEKKKNTRSAGQSSASGELTKILIATFCDQWNQRYPGPQKFRPSPKDVGLLKRMNEAYGLTQSQALVETYFQMPDAWFITKAHDVATLVGSVSKVQQFMNSGKIVTLSVVKQMQEQVDKIQSTTGKKSLDELVAEREAQGRQQSARAIPGDQ